jgi:hypothetical protein
VALNIKYFVTQATQPTPSTPHRLQFVMLQGFGMQTPLYVVPLIVVLVSWEPFRQVVQIEVSVFRHAEHSVESQI